MILLTPDIRFALRANNIALRAAQRDGRPEPDAVPVLKLFNPIGPALWIATELGPDDDAMVGAADLGFGCPELGYFSVSEIAAIRLPFGLSVERDTAFVTRTPLSAASGASQPRRRRFCSSVDGDCVSRVEGPVALMTRSPV